MSDSSVSTRPGAVAGALVGLTVRLLPREFRDRYEDEFRADLCYLPRWRQSPHAIGLLIGAIPLRRAVRHAQAQSEVFWLCRLGRHKYAVVSDGNPEEPGARHRECVRCTKTRHLQRDVGSAQEIWGTGWIGGGGGVV